MIARRLAPLLAMPMLACSAPSPASPQAPAPAASSEGGEPAPVPSVLRRPGEGFLEASVIEGVVRKGFDRFRDCYDAGVARNPLLKGRVSVSFTILPDGSVSGPVSTKATSLDDARVVRCVLRAWTEFRFPPPDGGPYTVVYPIDFAPAK